MPVYLSQICRTPGNSQKGSMKYGLSILLCCLSRCILEIGSLDFSEFWHGARNLYEKNLMEKLFWPKNLGNEPKRWFFKSKEKFGY